MDTMDTYTTINYYEKWLLNKKINPITGRCITNNSRIYKKYMNINIKELYIKECINDIDPISRAVLWVLENNNKIIKYKNINNLIFYRDSNNNIKCFEMESVEYMKGYNITLDPVTREELPNYLFDNILGAKLTDEDTKSSDILAFDVIQLFNNQSIFIDHTLILELDKKNLLVLYYEISDFYNNNLTDDQKNLINTDVFIMSNIELKKHDTEFIKKYILKNMKILLELDIEDLKFMINYILVAGLGLVIPSIKEQYPDFSFTF